MTLHYVFYIDPKYTQYLTNKSNDFAQSYGDRAYVKKGNILLGYQRVDVKLVGVYGKSWADKYMAALMKTHNAKGWKFLLNYLFNPER